MVDRVILGALPGGGYGLAVYAPDSTVIIDGTSEMFRIVATGTVVTPSFSNPGDSGLVTVNVATGLAYAPTHLIWVQFGSGTIGQLVPYAVWNNQDYFTGYTEAGAGSSTDVRVHTFSSRASGTSVARTYRYYILSQTSI